MANNVIKLLTREEKTKLNRMSSEEREEYLENKRKTMRVPKKNELDDLPEDDVHGTLAKDVEKTDDGEKTIEKSVTREEKEATREALKEEKANEVVHIPIADNFNKSTYSIDKYMEDISGTQESNYIYIGIVFDATYSAHKVFIPLYNCIKTMLNKIDSYKRQYKGVVIKYGIVVFDDGVHEATFDEDNNEYFTESKEELLKKLENIAFSGGSSDGYEDKLNDAIEKMIEILGNSSQSEANRGIIYFSDSIPKNTFPDFTGIECENQGVRFATGFINDSDSVKYFPDFIFVNGYGNETQEEKNRAESRNISELLGGSSFEIVENVVKDIMSQTSVFS